MIFVSEAERGKAPGIFEIGVKGEAVSFYGERGAVAKQLHGAGEIVRPGVLESFTPTGRSGRESAHGKSNGGKVARRGHATATVEAALVRVQFGTLRVDA